jgi:hypothetical protein
MSPVKLIIAAEPRGRQEFTVLTPDAKVGME